VDDNMVLLDLLIEEQGFISGEAIAERLKVSRTAVWKKIKALRDQGFHIESQSNLGYCLVSCPDKLLPFIIKRELSTDFIGQEIHYYPVTTSTNVLAKEFASRGAAEGTLLIAEEQTQGRGRMGRSWLSPAGKNILMSLILRPHLSPIQVSYITMIASLSVMKAIRALTPLEALIKWPNDIMIRGRKVGGILTEFSAEMDQVIYVVVGIGINVNFDPTIYPEIADSSTSIYLELGEEFSRPKFLLTLLQTLEKEYKRLQAGRGSDILTEWRSSLMMLNKEVQIISELESLDGTAEDVDEHGALILRLASGQKVKVFTGDVSLRTHD
jgi:BirA family biotin operon repressor/biotin-[acetyl-CoA-carboxylase] ligase